MTRPQSSRSHRIPWTVRGAGADDAVRADSVATQSSSQADPSSHPARTSGTEIDDKIDTVLRALRSTSPDPAAEQAALTDLLGGLG